VKFRRSLTIGFSKLAEDPTPNLTSLMFNVENKTGELQKALQLFWKHDINLTRIESRPTAKGKETEVCNFISLIECSQILHLVLCFD
jgi:prephenate dehydratase